jgi:hypothetical protein
LADCPHPTCLAGEPLQVMEIKRLRDQLLDRFGERADEIVRSMVQHLTDTGQVAESRLWGCVRKAFDEIEMVAESESTLRVSDAA